MMHNFFFTIMAAIFLSSCVSQGPRPLRFEGQTMGTYYRVTLVTDQKEMAMKSLQEDVEKYLSDFDLALSNYRPDSEIKKFNQLEANKEMELSPLLAETLKLSKEMAILSQGHFDISVYPAVLLWGFGGGVKRTSEPTSQEIEQVKSFVGMRHILFSTESKIRKVKSEVQIDVNGIAPGVAVDDLSMLLRKKGYPNHLVEIGGEVRASGKKHDNTWWQIGIETPAEKAELGQGIMKVIALKNKSLATSGNYRSFYKIKGKKFGHTLNPVTARPIEHNLASVTVVADHCYQADAWATALMVMGPELGFQFSLDKKLMAYFIVYEQGQFMTKITPELENYLKGAL